MRGLMMGRFQPFHLGHLELAKQILKDCDELVVAITSSQFNYLTKDPFTAGERIEMIHQSLNEEGIEMNNCYIISVENQFNIATWASYLQAALPKFDKVYSGNDYVRMLLDNYGINVVSPKFLNRQTYNATSIRNLMIQNNEWEKLVPKAVALIISRIRGVNRLQTILKSDTKPTEF